jgi:hypothetical protein
MLFTDLRGRKRDIPLSRYLIDWDPPREVSKPQAAVKAFLRPFWSHKQVVEEFRIPGSKLRLDLYCIPDNLVIEVSPEATHTKYNPFMHGSLSGYRGVMKRDLQKVEWCERNGLTLVTLVDEDIANLSVERFRDAFGVTL